MLSDISSAEDRHAEIERVRRIFFENGSSSSSVTRRAIVTPKQSFKPAANLQQIARSKRKRSYR